MRNLDMLNNITGVNREVHNMTQLLDKAFAQAAKLPPQEQDVIASHILDELESEGEWRQQFNGSQDALASLADEALQEHRQGQTKDLDLN